jgi:hypothetical protein
MDEGVIVHRRAGGEGSSLSESYGDLRAAKGLGEAKREYVGLMGKKVVWGRGGWCGGGRTHQEAQVVVEGRGCLLSQGGEHGEYQTGWECEEHWLLRDVEGWWGVVAEDTRDAERGYKGNTGGGDTH